jgi:hypothetical protein
MTTERFWVLGGQYSCPAFKTLNGQAEVLGPFDSRDEAQAAWKEASGRAGSALAKYAITSEQLVLPQ